MQSHAGPPQLEIYTVLFFHKYWLRKGLQVQSGFCDFKSDINLFMASEFDTFSFEQERNEEDIIRVNISRNAEAVLNVSVFLINVVRTAIFDNLFTDSNAIKIVVKI